MTLQNEIYNFYNKSHINEISRKGYYDEKIAFYIDQMKVLAKSNSNLKILDVACNDGGVALKLKKFGDILGIDINRDAIKKCKANGISCLHTDISGLDKKYHGYFDVIIAGDIIEHVFDTDSFLAKIKNLLRPGGTLLLTTANIASVGRRIMLLLGINPFTEFSTILPNKEFNVGHIRYYTVANMQDQLTMLDFRGIRIFGDRINITERLHLPRVIAKYVPTISRYMHVVAHKKK